MGEELENVALQCLVRGEVAKVVENLADHNFLVFSNHVVGNDALFFQECTSALNMTQRFSLVTDRAVRGVFFAPLIKEGTAGELEADGLYESFLGFLRE
jgi:hypothetical protein